MNIHIIRQILWLGALALGMAAGLSGAGASTRYGRVELVRVVDGDTVRLDIEVAPRLWVRNQSCRLAGIDTPERGEEGFDEASAALAGVLRGKALAAERVAIDKYGRWVIKLYADGESVVVKLNGRRKRPRRKMILYPFRKHRSPETAFELGGAIFWAETRLDERHQEVHRFAWLGADRSASAPAEGAWHAMLGARFERQTGSRFMLGVNPGDPLAELRKFATGFQEELKLSENGLAQKALETWIEQAVAAQGGKDKEPDEDAGLDRAEEDGP